VREFDEVRRISNFQEALAAPKEKKNWSKKSSEN